MKASALNFAGPKRQGTSISKTVAAMMVNKTEQIIDEDITIISPKPVSRVKTVAFESKSGQDVITAAKENEAPQTVEDGEEAAAVFKNHPLFKQLTSLAQDPDHKRKKRIRKTMTAAEIAAEDKNEYIKHLLFQTQFLHQHNQHSNPILQNKIQEDEHLRNQNATMNQENAIYPDYILKAFEAIKSREISKYETMIADNEKSKSGGRNVLEAGTVVNDCTMVYSKPYLNKFKLRYSLTGEAPIIAKISYSAFRECLKKSNLEHIEKLVLFSRSLPGF